MFTSKWYATRGIATEVGLDIQLTLWSMIDKRKKIGIEVDYLQVFELSINSKDGISVQKVIHRQECPPAIATYFLPIIETPIEMTIWAMDSEEYCMMLLPEEY
ncbi:MAG TPA: DUF960 family protein [Methylomusa anaerophila]|uniref:DUF960 domain-containing protein n=1 Tax=Methylomusa anaerophila TaxID=1930071 RepID=A0A348AMI1_9FIRM|nr:DUF960 family protein [Methylomusa anaerophila]BBB92279.1 hypothetical protein MAMMFC1_02964 [Methylomusa anaerophila]HML90261.1 DUF960 family protein [Methylomusa anaerophila]